MNELFNISDLGLETYGGKTIDTIQGLRMNRI
jgi:hypothetical protein